MRLNLGPGGQLVIDVSHGHDAGRLSGVATSGAPHSPYRGHALRPSPASSPEGTRALVEACRQTRGGRLYDSTWGDRMVGDGPYAWMIGRRFEIAAERLGFNKEKVELRTDLFAPPVLPGQQLRLI